MATFARVGSANDAAAESSKIVTATLQIRAGLFDCIGLRYSIRKGRECEARHLAKRQSRQLNVRRNRR